VQREENNKKVRLEKLLVGVVALLVFVSGLLNLVSAIWLVSSQRLELLDRWLPLEVIGVSRTFTLVAGIFLVYVSKGLWERKMRSWWIAMGLLVVSFGLHLVKGLGVEEALWVLVPIGLLGYSKPLYRVRSSKTAVATLVKMGVGALMVLFVYTVVGLALMAPGFDRHLSVKLAVEDYVYSVIGLGHDTLVPKTRQARWFEDSITVGGVVVLGYVFGLMFVPWVEEGMYGEDFRRRVREKILFHSQNSLGYFGMMADKKYYWSKDGEWLVVYKVGNGVAVVLGEPIGSGPDLKLVVREFMEYAHGLGLVVVFLGVSERVGSELGKLGFGVVKYGEEAVIRLNNFDLEGSRLAEVRHCVSRMTQREGVEYGWYQMDGMPWKVVVEISKLHQVWQQSKMGPGLTFSVNFYPLPVEKEAWVLVVGRVGGEVWGGFTFFPYWAGKGMVLDEMLRDQKAPNGMVEAAIAEAAEFFRGRGVEELSLGMAPLADVEPQKQKPVVAKGFELIFDHVKRVYGYKSLFRFKQKFNPDWQHRYLVYENPTQLPRVMVGLVGVHVEGGKKAIHGGV